MTTSSFINEGIKETFIFLSKIINKDPILKPRMKKCLKDIEEKKIKSGKCQSIDELIMDIKAAKIDYILQPYLEHKVAKLEKLIQNKNTRNFEQNLINAYKELNSLLMNPPKDSDISIPEEPPNKKLEPFTKERIGSLIQGLTILCEKPEKKAAIINILKSHNFVYTQEIDLSFASRALLLELEEYVQESKKH